MPWERGTAYGHRTAKEYNRIKALATEQEEGRPVILRHFARKLKNDHFIAQFCVINGYLDPSMFVQSKAPDGSYQRWARIEENGVSVFVPPDGYDGGPIHWHHDKRFLEESLVFESTKEFLDLGGIKA